MQIYNTTVHIIKSFVSHRNKQKHNKTTKHQTLQITNSQSKELKREPRKQLLCLLSKMAFCSICPSAYRISDCVCVSVKLSVCVRQEVVNHLESFRNAVSSQAALQGVFIFPFSKHHPILQQTGPSTFCSGWPKTHRHTGAFIMYGACGRESLFQTKLMSLPYSQCIIGNTKTVV